MVDSISEIVNKKFNENDQRLNHIHNVVKLAKELANLNDINIEDAEIAALFHDFYRLDNLEAQISKLELKTVKMYSNTPAAFHGFCASNYLKNEFNIKNKDILNSVSYHTFGRKNMSKLEKIIFLADKLSYDRDFEGINDLRKVSYINIDEATCLTMKSLINYYQINKFSIHEDLFQAYEELKEKCSCQM